MALDGDHYKLAFDKPGSWSQKYNLVWDQLLDLHLFPPDIRQTEMAFYLKHINRLRPAARQSRRLYQARLGDLDGHAHE